jgi:uncharacterized protein YhhL (DUF1145 family)
MSISTPTTTDTPVNRQPFSHEPANLFSRHGLRGVKFKMSDFVFWAMMLFANIPQILTLWGIDTVFKPYRMLALVASLLAFKTILAQDRVSRLFTRPMLAALVYVFVVTVIFAGAEFVDQVPFLVACLTLFFASFAVTSRQSLFIGMLAFVLSFLVSSYFGVIAFNSGKYRLSGLFENPNAFGYGGCLALAVLLNRFYPLPTIIKWLVSIALMPVLVLTGSRGTILAGTGLVASQTWRNKNTFFFLCLAALAAWTVIEIFPSEIDDLMGRSVMTRLTDADVVRRGSEGRLAQISAGMQVAAEHGFMGCGLGQYRLQHHTRFFQHRGLDGQISRLEIHNVYVSLLCEWGIVGFYCFFLIIRRLLVLSKGRGLERDFIYGFLGASFLNGLGNNLLGEVPFWIMLGVCVQLCRFSYLGNDKSNQIIGGRQQNRVNVARPNRLRNATGSIDQV